MGLVDFDGEFYCFQGVLLVVCLCQLLYILIYFSGFFDVVIEVVVRYVDIYMFWGELLVVVDGYIC